MRTIVPLPRPSILLSVMLAATAANAGILVPGTANLWLAGQPDGTTAAGGDAAPGQSPILVSGITAGSILTFSVTGSASHVAGPSGYPPDGGPLLSHFGVSENGIAGLTAPLDALVGVFLDNSVPGPSGIPAALDFGSIGLSFASLSPALRQPFFIGNGLTSAVLTQQFQVPTGATRLYLGSMDAIGWYNNSGQLDVTISGVTAEAPEPAANAALVGLGFAGFALYRRLRHGRPGAR